MTIAAHLKSSSPAKLCRSVCHRCGSEHGDIGSSSSAVISLHPARMASNCLFNVFLARNRLWHQVAPSPLVTGRQLPPRAARWYRVEGSDAHRHSVQPCHVKNRKARPFVNARALPLHEPQDRQSAWSATSTTRRSTRHKRDQNRQHENVVLTGRKTHPLSSRSALTKAHSPFVLETKFPVFLFGVQAGAAVQKSNQCDGAFAVSGACG